MAPALAAVRVNDDDEGWILQDSFGYTPLHIAALNEYRWSTKTWHSQIQTHANTC